MHSPRLSFYTTLHRQRGTPSRARTTMTPLRAISGTAIRSLRSTPASARAFSTTPLLRGGGHESHYDAPGGWLFGVKPGEEYKKEGWEGPIYWGMGGSVVFAIVAYAFKPDTR